ncbi:nucleoid-associated protein NdpA [Photobacterium malacitanum]|uniref:Nucleoid-associated protein NdpA n=1 Tax=Photobacterium malacitanum TaxID=2204294 RepID=A0A1Y6M5I6_9GAMM|nr:nucleoid-associated protein [Photobacterium malacitanum]SMY31824.1 nucleoid-associated protein NdpA [Photobacterium malacitanum]
MYTCHNCDTSFSQSECPSCDALAIPLIDPSLNELVAVHAVTLELDIDKKKQTIVPKLGMLWPLQKEDVSYNFIKQVELKFKRKNKFHSYYEKNTDNKIPSHIHKYIQSSASQEDFKLLVKSMTSELTAKIFETGVHKVSSCKIVFMHYRNTKNDDFGKFLAVMVDTKLGFDFTTDSLLLPKSAAHINLEALKQAVSINIDLFSQCYPNTLESEAYLKFIRGSSSAEYFRTAFGCKEKSDNGQSLQNLYEAISQFSVINGLSSDFEENATSKLTGLLAKTKKSETTSFSLSEAATVIESELPKECEHLKDTFITFVNENELLINYYIEPTRKQIEDQHWIDLSDEDHGLIAKLHCNNEIGNSGDGKDVEYNKQTKRLEIRINNSKLREKILRMIEKSGS